MSKELPYFKFYVSEWMLGRIYDEPDKVQGAFLVAICYYWHKKCDCFVSSFSKKIGKKRFELLKNLKYIEVKNDKVSISFLDEQFVQLSDIKLKRSKGGVARAKQMHKHKDKQKPSYIEVEIDKEIEIEEMNSTFECFWVAYGKKTGKADCLAKWKRLSKTDRQAILIHVPKYVASTPEVKYRKNPETYLNGKHWEDEILLQSEIPADPNKPIQPWMRPVETITNQ